MLKIDFENQILALFDVYFWPFNKSQERINTIQSEMFLSNCIAMMKNCIRHALYVTVVFLDPN